MPLKSRWRAVRESAGISFLDAYKALGISKGALSKLENDVNFASRPVLERACSVYGCNLDDLYEHAEGRKETAISV